MRAPVTTVNPSASASAGSELSGKPPAGQPACRTALPSTRWARGPDPAVNAIAPPAPSAVTAIGPYCDGRPSESPVAGQPGAAAPDRVMRRLRPTKSVKPMEAPPGAGATAATKSCEAGEVVGHAKVPGSRTASGRTTAAATAFPGFVSIIPPIQKQ